VVQAEDGIRDRNVTGVQTCALPIFCFLVVGTGRVSPPPQQCSPQGVGGRDQCCGGGPPHKGQGGGHGPDQKTGQAYQGPPVPAQALAGGGVGHRSGQCPGQVGGGGPVLAGPCALGAHGQASHGQKEQADRGGGFSVDQGPESGEQDHQGGL